MKLKMSKKKLFTYGYQWAMSGQQVKYWVKDSFFLFINGQQSILTWSDSRTTFDCESRYVEISSEELIGERLNFQHRTKMIVNKFTFLYQ